MSQGRGRPCYPKPEPIPEMERAKDVLFSNNSAIDRHDLMEYSMLTGYDPAEDLNPEDVKYFEKCKEDLKEMLEKYKEVRVRDIKKNFATFSHEMNLDRLKLQSWTHFLLTCSSAIVFKVKSHQDIDKEELFAYPITEKEEKVDDGEENKVSKMTVAIAVMQAKDAFMKGFLDVADGCAKVDPRVPIQDKGVAATELINQQKLLEKTSSGQHVFFSSKPNKNIVVMETTGPIKETLNGSAERCFKSFPSEPDTTSSESFPRPSWCK